MATYPRLGLTEWEHGENRYKPQCDVCEHEINKGDEVFVIEIQYNWFRGDDEVAFICPACFNKHELARFISPSPDEKKLITWVEAVQAERGAEKERSDKWKTSGFMGGGE